MARLRRIVLDLAPTVIGECDLVFKKRIYSYRDQDGTNIPFCAAERRKVRRESSGVAVRRRRLGCDAGPASLTQRGQPNVVRPVQRGVLLCLFSCTSKKIGRLPGRIPARGLKTKPGLPRQLRFLAVTDAGGLPLHLRFLAVTDTGGLPLPTGVSSRRFLATKSRWDDGSAPFLFIVKRHCPDTASQNRSLRFR